MKKVLILVEGQTEETFVNWVLYEHLYGRDILILPIIVTTRRDVDGVKHKGGYIKYGTAKKEVLRLLGDSSADLVTTMFDYYGLPDDFPGRTNIVGDPHEKVSIVETGFNQDINNPRFSSFFFLHEYEGLLFSSPPVIAQVMNEPNKEPILNCIRASFRTPEDINDSPETAPSKRIRKEFPKYEKIFHGATIASRIGLSTIRKECPHFNEWLNRIERL